MVKDRSLDETDASLITRVMVSGSDGASEPVAVRLSRKLETPKLAENPAIALDEQVIETAQPAVNQPIHGKHHGLLWSRLGTLVVGVAVTIAVILVGLRLAGFRTFTVMSGSMTPEYPVGSLIFVQPVDYYNLKVGDVISYVANDNKIVVTHRITEIEVDKNDTSIWRFKTKGDANDTADAKLVHYKNVLGTPIITIPLIGYFAYNIQQPPGIYIALVVGTLLLAWAFLPGTLEERRKTARKSIA